jgi:hypothetical protein
VRSYRLLVADSVWKDHRLLVRNYSCSQRDQEAETPKPMPPLGPPNDGLAVSMAGVSASWPSSTKSRIAMPTKAAITLIVFGPLQHGQHGRRTSPQADTESILRHHTVLDATNAIYERRERSVLNLIAEANELRLKTGTPGHWESPR